jgi:hypothetical protein
VPDPPRGDSLLLETRRPPMLGARVDHIRDTLRVRRTVVRPGETGKYGGRNTRPRLELEAQ